MRARELKAARARLGLSQAALAEALEVHRVTITVYEAGRQPIPRLVALAVEALERRSQAASKSA
jgi:DNA-binding XRE family transcriptional regulator